MYFDMLGKKINTFLNKFLFICQMHETISMVYFSKEYKKGTENNLEITESFCNREQSKTAVMC